MADKRTVVRDISSRYLISLGVIAVVVLISQIYLQVFLNSLSTDGREINLAGKMRMLSQRTAKLTLMVANSPESSLRRTQLQETLNEFEVIFNGLEQGDENLKVKAAPTELIRGLFTQSRPILDKTLYAANCLLQQTAACASTDKVLAEIGENDDLLLSSIARIPQAYDDLATAGVASLRRIQVLLLGITLGALLLTVIFVLRPILRTVLEALDSTRSETADDQRMRRLASMGEMSGGIAHEINSPLAAISFAIQRLQRKLKRGRPISDEDLKDQLEHMATDTHRIGEIVESVRSLAAGKLPENKQPALVGNLFAHAADEFLERQRSGGIELHVIEAPTDLRLPCVEYQIQQILVNLMRNAADAIRDKEDPWVELSAAVNGDQVEVHVRDCGKGIPPSAAEKIFDPFYSTKGIGGGMGLGLSLCRKLADLHGGDLNYSLREGHTCFTLSLPAHDAISSDEEPGSAEDPASEESTETPDD